MDDDQAADQNAPTRTVAPIAPDADRTRSSAADPTVDPAAPSDGSAPYAAAPDGTPPDAESSRGPRQPRLPAPLQYRDPDRYDVVAEHGRGGLGRVLHARDRELGRSVAIKELLAPTKTSELRFFREALITARLEHPGIVPVHEAGRWPDGTPFYAMKFVAGRPLKDLIDQASTLEQRLTLLPHVVAVADAVAYAHSKGIIHRDLKPANVIVGDFGETVVVDWGLAKSITDSSPDEAPSAASASAPPDVTALGSIVGTPAYMSPEQAAGKPVGIDADIYSLGALLEHLVTGRTPSPAGPAASPAVPRELWAIVIRARHRDPAQRYPSAEALSSDLRHFLTGQQVSAHQYTLRERFWRWVSRRRAAVLATVVASVAIASGSLLALRTSLRERDTARAATAEIAKARAVAEQERDRAVFANATAQLVQDPTATLNVLRGYGGSDPEPAAILAAKALARRPAAHVLTPLGTVVAGVTNDALTTIVMILKSNGTMPIVIWNPQRRVATTIPDVHFSDAIPAVSPDGTLVALVSNKGVIIREGVAPHTVVTQAEIPPPRWLWFSPTEFCWADSAGIDCVSTAKIRDALSSKRRIFNEPITQLLYSQSGEAIVFCSRGTAYVHSRHRTSTLGPCGKGHRIDASPRGRVVALHMPNRRVQIWNDAGTFLGEAGPPARSITAVLESPPAIAAAAPDRSVTVIEADGRVRRLTPMSGRPTAISAGAGDSFTVGDDVGTITTYSATNSTNSLHRQSRAIRGITQSLSASMVVTMTFEDLRIWSTDTSSTHWSICETPIFNLVASESALYADDAGGHLHQIDKASRVATIVAEHESVAFGLALSANHRRVASAGWDSKILVHARAPTVTQRLEANSIPRALVYSESGILVSAHENGEIVAWHENASRTVYTHNERAYRLAAHPSRGHVASTSMDTTAAVHDITSMRTIKVLRDAAGATSRVAYAADTLWVSSLDGHVRGYDSADGYQLTADVVRSGRPTARIVAMNDGDVAAAWEGGDLAVASKRGVVTWSVSIPAHQITALASRDSLLAVGTDDGYIYLFDVPKRTVAAIWSSADIINDLMFDGEHLLTAGGDGYLRRYSIPATQLFVPMPAAELQQFLETQQDQTDLSLASARQN